VFSSYLELPIGVVATVLLALVLIYGVTSRNRLIRLGVLATAAFVAAPFLERTGSTVLAVRNFYGTLQVRDRGEGDAAVRTLYNGRTVHGAQFLAPARRRIATTYYGERSGAGLLLRAADAPARSIAVIGLGAGTLAAYGRTGDRFTFYEINPAVMEAASRQFSFLADSGAAISVINGDGRTRLELEPPASFDAIVLDAFSDDAIPVHLLTREAFRMYFARLRPAGTLAIHVTNRYLDVYPVVESLGDALQKRVLRIHSAADPERQTQVADWAIASSDGATVEKLAPYAAPRPAGKGPLWTDDYSNLFQIWSRLGPARQ
jgi:SAM-dependent methyltransferase